MFFDSFDGIARTIVVGVLAYIALVSVLRMSGNRTLAKMNAFDLVVTVALGSTLATILLTEDVALAEGIVAYGVLIGMQFLVTWSSVRSARISALVKGDPVLLYYDNTLLEGQLRQARVEKAEILAAVRSAGMASLDSVQAIVLEADGSFTVVPQATGTPSVLDNVTGYPPA